MKFYQSTMMVKRSLIALGFFLLSICGTLGQVNSVVLIHADKTSGYGVAWGGPQNSSDLIVTSLHLVAGKKQIQVVYIAAGKLHKRE